MNNNTINTNNNNNTINNELLIHLHLYNYSLFEELSTYINNVTINYDLYVTLGINSERDLLERIKQKEHILKVYPQAIILIITNYGYDTYAFIEVLKYLKSHNKLHYKYLFKIHSKTDDYWRRTLLDPLVKSKEKFNENLHLLQTNTSIYMIGAKLWRNINDRYPEVTGAMNMIKEAGITIELNICAFVAGTIFLCKFDLLREWTLRVDLQAILEDNYPKDVAGRKDLIPYMIERLFGALISTQKDKIIHFI